MIFVKKARNELFYFRPKNKSQTHFKKKTNLPKEKKNEDLKEALKIKWNVNFFSISVQKKMIKTRTTLFSRFALKLFH